LEHRRRKKTKKKTITTIDDNYAGRLPFFSRPLYHFSMHAFLAAVRAGELVVQMQVKKLSFLHFLCTQHAAGC
jgi:hypothetical protein